MLSQLELPMDPRCCPYCGQLPVVLAGPEADGPARDDRCWRRLLNVCQHPRLHRG